MGGAYDILRKIKFNQIINKPKLMKITSWKTTSFGILTIIGAIVGLIYTPEITAPVIMLAATDILIGIGLLFSKDSNVSGGTVGSTPEAQKRIGLDN